MFPLADESLSFLEIARHWSRGSGGKFTEKQAMNSLLKAFWLDELDVATPKISDVRDHILQHLLNRYDQPGFIITTEQETQHPDEIELDDNEVWCGWRLHLSKTDGHQTAFEKLSQTDIDDYSDALKNVLYFMTVTKTDFLSWCHLKKFPIPQFWYAGSTTQAAKVISESQLQKWLIKHFAKFSVTPRKNDVWTEAKLAFPAATFAAFKRAWSKTRPNQGRKGGRRRSQPKS